MTRIVPSVRSRSSYEKIDTIRRRRTTVRLSISNARHVCAGERRCRGAETSRSARTANALLYTINHGASSRLRRPPTTSSRTLATSDLGPSTCSGTFGVFTLTDRLEFRQKVVPRLFCVVQMLRHCATENLH